MNTIRKEIDEHSLANEIRMLRSQRSNLAFVLVEGDTDSMFMRKFLDETVATTINCIGKDRAIATVLLLESKGFVGMLAFVDRDYDDLLDNSHESTNIILTDANDIELMIVLSDALANFLREFGSDAKIKSEESARNCNIREIIIRSAAPLGAVRFVSQREGIPLKFSGVKYKFRRDDKLKIDYNSMINILVQRSDGVLSTHSEKIRKKSSRLMQTQDYELQVCNGHDVVEVLRNGLKKILGTCNNFTSCNGEVYLGKVLRLSYEFSFFKKTQAFSDMKKWEKRTSFRLFPGR